MFWLVSLLYSFVPNGGLIMARETLNFYNILLDKNIPFHSHSSRIKTFDSALIKHKQPQYCYRDIYDLHDLIGLRFIFYNENDLFQ